MISLNRRDIDRLIISIVIAVFIHILLFFVLPFIIRLGKEEVPRYSGPVFVRLEEVPTLGKTVVKERANREKPVERVPPAEKTIAKQKKTSEQIGVSPEKQKNARVESAHVAKKIPSQSLQPEGKSESLEGVNLPSANPVSPERVERSISPYSVSESSKSMAPGAVVKSRPALPESGNLYKNENPAESAGTEEEKSGKSENLALSESVYSRLDRLLKEKAGKSSSVKSESRVGTGGAASEGKTGENTMGESAGRSQSVSSGPNIQWEKPSQRRVPLSMPLPKIPEWVAKQGLTLKVTVAFELLPEGIIKSLKVLDSSGYSDVDSAVVEALRHWRFEAVSGTKVVRGKITYIIKPKE